MIASYFHPCGQTHAKKNWDRGVVVLIDSSRDSSPSGDRRGDGSRLVHSPAQEKEVT